MILTRKASKVRCFYFSQFQFKISRYLSSNGRWNLLSFEWNSIRLGGPAHGIMTKTVCQGVVGLKGVVSGRIGGGGVRG